MMKSQLLVATLSGLLVACPKPDSPSKPKAASPATPPAAAASQPARPSSQPSSQPSGSATQPAQSAIATRVTAAKARLAASEAGKILLKSTETHGGLEAWFSSQALQFRYNYQPVQGVQRNSLQTVDLLSSRAYHELDAPAKGKLAFDGDKAWMKLEGGAKFAARFWALTPYYFVGMPFVLSDPGVKLSMSADDPKAAGLPQAHVIRAAFDPGTGDAPDDYYVLYIAKDDHRLLALRYVVSYAPFFEGKPMKSTPEKLLVYEDVKPLGPLKLSRQHLTYAFKDGKRGDKVTVSDITEMKYAAPFDEARLRMPQGAVIDESL